VFSAKEKIFSPQTAARHYRLRNSGGSMSKSPKPGTKLEPQWCPSGLTHTQKRRVQRLRASEIKEETAEKKRNKWFNRDRPMMSPKMTWKRKCITVEQNKNMNGIVSYENSESENDKPTNEDDTVAAKDINMAPDMIWQERIVKEIKKAIDDTVSNGTSENKEDTPCDMVVDIVFALPAEFCAPKVKVAGAYMIN
jgi:hypothetical protein